MTDELERGMAPEDEPSSEGAEAFDDVPPEGWEGAETSGGSAEAPDEGEEAFREPEEDLPVPSPFGAMLGRATSPSPAPNRLSPGIPSDLGEGSDLQAPSEGPSPGFESVERVQVSRGREGRDLRSSRPNGPCSRASGSWLSAARPASTSRKTGSGLSSCEAWGGISKGSLPGTRRGATPMTLPSGHRRSRWSLRRWSRNAPSCLPGSAWMRWMTFSLLPRPRPGRNLFRRSPFPIGRRGQRKGTKIVMRPLYPLVSSLARPTPGLQSSSLSVNCKRMVPRPKRGSASILLGQPRPRRPQQRPGL